MQSEPSSGIKLTAYSCICWLFHRIYYDARNIKHKTLILIFFNIQGSVHCKYIPLDIFPRCNITQFIYFWETALHVSGGNSTHHQEHIQLYLQYLVLVKGYCYLSLLWESWSWSECGVGIVPVCDVSSNSPTIEAGGSNG